MSWLSFLFFGALAATAADPPTLTVVLDLRPGAAALSQVELQATLQAPESDEVRAMAHAGQSRILTLPKEGTWRLTCEGPGVWCPEVLVDIRGSGGSTPLPVFSSSRMTGSTLPPRGEQAPGWLAVQGWVYSGGRLPIEFFREVVVEEHRFGVDLPRAEVDLRLAAEGFVPHYVWSLEPKEATHDLGSFRLKRGGSVSGFVLDPAAEVPAAGVRVTLGLPGDLPLDEERHRVELLRQHAQTNERGFFQLVGVQPGRYRLKLQRAEDPATVFEPVDVSAGAETQLQEIRLTNPATIDVLLDPPADPEGRPWRVELFPQDPRAFGLPLSSRTDAAGVARFDRIATGRYEIFVSTQAGSRLAQQDEEFTEDGLVSISLPLVEVIGSLRLGDEPIAGQIRVMTGESDEARFRATAEEQFRGWMRRPTKSWLMVRVKSEEHQIDRELDMTDVGLRGGVVHLDICLADIRLSGVVITEDGALAEGARVRAEAADQDRLRASSEADGSFELRGLGAKRYRIWADHPEGTSEPVEVDASNEISLGDLRLILWRGREIEGLLLSAEGYPVAAAEVQIDPVGRVGSGRMLQTDPAGRFRGRVGDGSERAVIRVMAPTQVLWAGCVGVPSEGVLTVQLPPLPGGTLEVQTKENPEAPPARNGRLVVFTDSGGFLDGGDLLAWQIAVTGRLASVDPDAEVVPAVAAGSYAVSWSAAPTWELVSRVCTVGPPSEVQWTTLQPGGTARLFYDLRKHQKQE